MHPGPPPLLQAGLRYTFTYHAQTVDIPGKGTFLERFAPGAFDRAIGTVVPLKLENRPVGHVWRPTSPRTVPAWSSRTRSRTWRPVTAGRDTVTAVHVPCPEESAPWPSPRSVSRSPRPDGTTRWSG